MNSKGRSARATSSLCVTGSPATLHKRITRLRQKELLSAHSEQGDRRAKYLVPTRQALDYFHHLGQTMQLAQTLQAS